VGNRIGQYPNDGVFLRSSMDSMQRSNPCRVVRETGRSDMANRPVLDKDGEQGSEDKPATQGSAHEPAKHIEETARLASSVEPNKDPEKVRIAGKRSERS
jgi:hypothetical protein